MSDNESDYLVRNLRLQDEIVELRKELVELTGTRMRSNVKQLEDEIRAATSQLAVEQALRKVNNDSLRELHDEVDYQIKADFPSVHRLQEENSRANQALSQTSSTSALDAAIVEAEIKVLQEASQWLAEDVGINARDALLKRIDQREEKVK